MNVLPFLPVVIATGFGVGFVRVAPGTAGAALAVLFWLLLHCFIPFSFLFYVTIAFILFFALIGIWATNKLEVYWGKDPSRVVVDEMVGVWIPILAVPNTIHWYWYLIGAFVLFRIFDICKPLGIRQMEKFKGGVGVMLDDVLAGVYSLLLLLALRWGIG